MKAERLRSHSADEESVGTWHENRTELAAMGQKDKHEEIRLV